MERFFVIFTVIILFASGSFVFADEKVSTQPIQIQPITVQPEPQAQTETQSQVQTQTQPQVQPKPQPAQPPSQPQPKPTTQTTTQAQIQAQPQQTQPKPQIQPQAQNPAVTVQNIPFENCTKMYATNKEQLFYLTLGAINANKFTIEEIQSYNGYIIFTAARQKYLATISGVDKDNSILKITPNNNIYYFQPGIVSNIFKFIDLNKSTEIK